ncbi:transcriptional elongation regulator MINIYO isoform X1 [Cucumis melo]|uniref:Transcriptional elongation regulator MINIYO isoform X1 n=1 Tax=Cucumis melo TaxID=3656 RepID=A0A1S3BKC4_CUCME|nr:transcriptional elongation regulator MINIYO isoform X1 [Cucumis melo]
MEKKTQSCRRSQSNSSARAKVFGTNSLQLSEDDATRLVGGIVEKGVSDSEQSTPFFSPAPRPSVLPFPVARHRSHGPHWESVTSKKGGDNIKADRGEDGEEDETMMVADSIANFANPIQRKKKSSLDFGRWREASPDHNHGAANREEKELQSLAKTASLSRAGEANTGTDDMSCRPFSVHVLAPSLMECERSSSDFVNDSTGNKTNSAGFELKGSDKQHLPENLQDVRDQRGDISESEVNESMQLDGTSLRDMGTRHHLNSEMTPCFQSNIKGDDAFLTLKSQIDAENRARMQKMSPEEIAEAQAEIMEKMSPALVKALKMRGEGKLKQGSSKPDVSSNYELGNLQKESRIDGNGSSNKENGVTSVKTTLKDTKSGLQDVSVQKIDSGSSIWNAWNERVEAVRSLRFSLEGNLVESYSFQQSKNVHGYSTENVASRDFLRTEGDPSAAGYTINEAVALTRSVIPGQRVLGLHVISNVLDKALLNTHLTQVGSTMIKNRSSVDYNAIWAYILGPEPELALSLRMCLDDNHNSVVLACAEVIQSVLSCNLNESFFDSLEKTSTYEKDLYTAAVFRSKPEINVGFLQGGFWKYSAKSSNILPITEDFGIVEDGVKYTIQDDIVVAQQDIAAGMVRMGILPRLVYLLEADPSVALEECILSILVAIARHSPICAQAIMKCDRLIELIVQRFTMSEKIDILSLKIKSVVLLKVLARSDRKNCFAFVKSGAFLTVIWHLYHYTSSIDQWLKSGKEKCKLSSTLMVEQLRLWKVCIQYGYCVSYFSDVFPSLCLWLNPPNFGKLIENNVLREFTTISMEAYHVLEALARRLPIFFSEKHLDSQEPGFTGDESEAWSWSCAVPMVDLAIKWLGSKKDPFICKFFSSQKGIRNDFVFEGISLAPLLWVYSAVFKMLSRVVERIPQDILTQIGSDQIVPWIPEFVPQVGLEIIKNGFLSFADASDMNPKTSPSGGNSFVEDLCFWREHGEFEMSLASVCCLHGLMLSIVNIDCLILLAKTESQAYPPKDVNSSREGEILRVGMFKTSLVEQRSMLDLFTKKIALECDSLRLIETFGRGGPAPGVGIGWGVCGGGYWSLAVLLAQNDSAFLMSLIEAFHTIPTLNGLTAQESLTLQSINSALAVCLVLGPRDIGLIEKTMEFLIQAPILYNFNLYIQRFLQLNGNVKQFGWKYSEDDCLIFCRTLSSHYKDRWLTPKGSKSVKNKSNLSDGTFKSGRVSLDTIYEESDETNRVVEGCTCLIVQWAYQRLPLPGHWFFSPVSTICYSKHASRQKSDAQSIMQESSDLFDVAKSGLFFILGIEAFSSFLPDDFPKPVLSVPLIWKLHSLSVVLLTDIGVLDDEKSRDVYEVLQDLYGQRLNEAMSCRHPADIVEKDAKHLPSQLENKRSNIEFLMFQSEIHDSYSLFIETLVEQFSSVSYGDVLYGRQIVLYLHRCVESQTRLAAWNALNSARVFELLPPLEKCLADAEGYLQPIEDNEAILEAYVKSWVSGALDRSASRGSVAYLLSLHHLSSYIFHSYPVNNLLLRNKLSRSLLRDCSQKHHRKEMMTNLILYTKPSTHLIAGQKGVGTSIGMSDVEKRLEVLKEACEKNSSLLTVVEELGSSAKSELSAMCNM